MFRYIIALLGLLWFSSINPALAQGDIPQTLQEDYIIKDLHGKVFMSYSPAEESKSSELVSICFTWNYCSLIITVAGEEEGKLTETRFILEGFYTYKDGIVQFRPKKGTIRNVTKGVSGDLDLKSMGFDTDLYARFDEKENTVYFPVSKDNKGTALRFIHQLSEQDLTTELKTLKARI